MQNNVLHVLIHAIAGDGSTQDTQLRERDESNYILAIGDV